MDNEEGVAEEIADDTPDWVKDGTSEDDIEIEGEDISKAESGGNQDWVEPAKDVTFEITSATLNTYTPDGETAWKSHSLKLYLRVDKDGIDGKGRYAGKMFFPNSFGNIGGLLIKVNRNDYDFTVNAQGKPTDFYKAGSGGAFADYKDFLLALGFPVDPTPTNTKALRDSLIGRKLIANIDKKPRRVKDGGKYVNVEGEFENEISKYRPVKLAVAPESAETAVA